MKAILAAMFIALASGCAGVATMNVNFCGPQDPVADVFAHNVAKPSTR